MLHQRYTRPLTRRMPRPENLEERRVPTFVGPVVSPHSGGGVYDAAVGDVNGDGKVDFVAAGDTSLGVQLGRGDGSFAPATLFNDPDFPKTMTLADFSGDGKLDALTTSSVTGLAKLWVNTGAGAFRLANTRLVGGGVSAAAPGDFNSDGRADIAVTRALNGGKTKTASVIVYFNNGASAFADVPASIRVGEDPMDVKAADVNNDGKLDVISADSSGGTVSVALGDGRGGFQTARSYGAGKRVRTVSVADFNGDGRLDLVSGSLEGELTVLVGRGDGTFTAGAALPAVTKGIWDIAVADFDGDGRADFAVTNGNTFGDPSSITSIHLGNGNGTFRTPINVTTPGANSWLIASDVNGDGRPDLVSSAYPELDVLLNDGKWGGV
jgi:hypothetical protein